MPRDLLLSEVKFPGVSHLEQRTWRAFYQLTIRWDKWFDKKEGILDKLSNLQNPNLTHNAAEYAIEVYKAPSKKGEEGERMIEALCSANDSVTKKRTFLAKQMMVGDGGKGYFQTLSEDADSATTRVLDPKKGGTLEQADDIVEVRHLSRIMSQPSYEGLVIVKEGKNYTIRRIDESSEDKFEARYWDLGEREPSRFEAFGDILVFTTTPSKKPPWWSNTVLVPSQLVCMVRGQEPGQSTIRWEYNILEEWKEPNMAISLPLGHGFHLTSKVAVFSISQPSTAYTNRSASASGFLVISLKNGSRIKHLPLSQAVYTPVSSGTNLSRVPWTSATSHNFLLTDTHLITGGPGGYLFVWSYWTAIRPIYILPDRAVKNNSLAPYINISLSACGRLVLGTVSDYLIVWDMFSKEVLGSWTSGKNSPSKRSLPAPTSDFPNGIWTVFRDYTRSSPTSTWAPGPLQVSYLSDTRISDRRRLAVPRRAFWKIWGGFKVGMKTPEGVVGFFIALVLGLLLRFVF